MVLTSKFGGYSDGFKCHIFLQIPSNMCERVTGIEADVKKAVGFIFCLTGQKMHISRAYLQGIMAISTYMDIVVVVVV